MAAEEWIRPQLHMGIGAEGEFGNKRPVLQSAHDGVGLPGLCRLSALGDSEEGLEVDAAIWRKDLFGMGAEFSENGVLEYSGIGS